MSFYLEGWLMQPIKTVSSSPRLSTKGFSFVELMVVLLFTAFLMAGLASVFKSSINTLATEGEKISNSRRNRLAIDMVYDDLNAAGMLLTSLTDYSGGSTNPISLNSTNPAFRIMPNVVYSSTDVASPNNTSDMLDLYFDEALPFEGTVSSTSQNVAQFLADGSTVNKAVTNSVTLTADQAALVTSENAKSPLSVIFRADVAAVKVPAALTATPSGVDITLSTDLQSAHAGPTKSQIPAGTPVLFVKPHLYVRYSIQPVNVDPDPANAGLQVPCLVRDEVLYDTVANSPTPFAAPRARTVVAENVIGFQVMVSPDGGQTWINNPYDTAQRNGSLPNAGNPGIPHTRFTTWDDLRNTLTNHPSIVKRPAPFNELNDSRFWFKDIPVTLRVDITSRTVRPRGEYVDNTPSTILNGTRGIPYKIQTQSVILVPRHFGLSYANRLL